MAVQWDERSFLVVVGASIEAERSDRALAHRLRDSILSFQQLLGPPQPFDILTCTDVWYLNDSSLLAFPAISIGSPETNAATAFLAGRIPTAMMIDQTYRIHLDPELVELRACLWGANPAMTKAAVEVFEQRYLEPFVRASHDLGVDVG